MRERGTLRLLIWIVGSVNVDGAQWYQYLPNVTTYEVPPNLTAVIGGRYALIYSTEQHHPINNPPALPATQA